ncbi:hypothetical protein [Mycobacterium sp. 1274761.0]|uniref:hypothetical protein n=1 Tax=Mycobacterium sp. 1274761.0 TaxID=1834077 RepID=UPI000A87F698|nr:hypothetical protein [Mycobacterium sp. 1274761.0]
MIIRIRTLTVTAVGAAVLAVGFGATAFGAVGTASGDVCWEYYTDGSVFYYYC